MNNLKNLELIFENYYIEDFNHSFSLLNLNEMKKQFEQLNLHELYDLRTLELHFYTFQKLLLKPELLTNIKQRFNRLYEVTKDSPSHYYFSKENVKSWFFILKELLEDENFLSDKIKTDKFKNFILSKEDYAISMRQCSPFLLTTQKDKDFFDKKYLPYFIAKSNQNKKDNNRKLDLIYKNSVKEFFQKFKNNREQ